MKWQLLFFCQQCINILLESKRRRNRDVGNALRFVRGQRCLVNRLVRLVLQSIIGQVHFDDRRKRCSGFQLNLACRWFYTRNERTQ